MAAAPQSASLCRLLRQYVTGYRVQCCAECLHHRADSAHNAAELEGTIELMIAGSECTARYGPVSAAVANGSDRGGIAHRPSFPSSHNTRHGILGHTSRPLILVVRR